eukprot:3106110-Rhodomonas_salina.1
MRPSGHDGTFSDYPGTVSTITRHLKLCSLGSARGHGFCRRACAPTDPATVRLTVTKTKTRTRTRTRTRITVLSSCSLGLTHPESCHGVPVECPAMWTTSSRGPSPQARGPPASSLSFPCHSVCPPLKSPYPFILVLGKLELESAYCRRGRGAGEALRLAVSDNRL